MIKTSLMARDAQLDALAALADSGFLRIYSGTQPKAPENAPAGAQLCELRLSPKAFRKASLGSIEANAINSNDATASGVASWYRLARADGKTPLWDGSVGVRSADPEKKPNPDLVLSSAVIEKGSKISVKQFTYDIPE